MILTMAIAVAVMTPSCGSGEQDHPDRPETVRPPSVGPDEPVGGDGEEVPLPEGFLDDDTPRFVSVALSLRYDSAGVIYSCDAATGRYSLIDITTGGCVVYDRSGSLSVNGVRVEVAAVEEIAPAGKTTDMPLRLKITDRQGHVMWLVLQDV